MPSLNSLEPTFSWTDVRLDSLHGATRRRHLTAATVVGYLTAAAMVSTAVVLPRDPSSWEVSTLLSIGILALLTIGIGLPRVATTWPASLAVLLLIVSRSAVPNIAWIEDLWLWDYLTVPPALAFSIPFLETLAAWPGFGALTGREKWFLATLLVLVIWGVAMPTLEQWLAEDYGLLALLVILFVLSARSLVSFAASFRAPGRSGRGLQMVSVAIPVALAIQIYGLWFGACAPAVPKPTPMVVAHEARRDLAVHYPRWKSDPKTLDGLWAAYQPVLSAASRHCTNHDEPCFEMLHVLERLFAELRNGHTAVVIPSRIGFPPISILSTEDGVGIDWVEPGSVAEAIGLTPGMKVLAVDGIAIDDAATRVPSWEIAYEAEHTRKHSAYQAVLKGLPGSTVTVTLETSPGSSRTVHLQRKSVQQEWERRFAEDYESEISWTVDADGFGKVWIESFKGPTMTARFTDAMSRMKGTTGLIVDLRGNGGGRVGHALDVLGHFFHDARVLGDGCARAGIEDVEYYCISFGTEPKPAPYRGSVAVLIDEEVASAAELVAYGLCTVGDARCFGHRTCGETDTVFLRDLPGARLGIASDEFRPAVGEPIQGVGIEPDVRVSLTLEDLRNGHDPFVDAAKQWLSSRM